MRGRSLCGLGSHLLPPSQSVLGKVNEIAKHKAIVQDADTQSKVRALKRVPSANPSMVWGAAGSMQTALTPPSPPVVPPLAQIHQVYEMMQRWDHMASSLPDVVQRLLTLRDLHEQGEGLRGSWGRNVGWRGCACP